MLIDADRQSAKAAFGADDSQVERDHLISHALAAISNDLGERIKFYGGTALSRTFLPVGRLSEDIDLIAVGPRADVADALSRSLTRRLAGEFGRPTFQPGLVNARGAEPVTAAFPSSNCSYCPRITTLRGLSSAANSSSGMPTPGRRPCSCRPSMRSLRGRPSHSWIGAHHVTCGTWQL